jgi:hypothetical protein
VRGIVAGTVLYIRDPHMGAHAFVVLTDPDPATQRVVVVPLVTARAHTDTTVLLVPGEHPFIRHDTHVSFGAATYAPVARLERKLVRGVVDRLDDQAGDVLARIQRGLLASSCTINEIAS